MFEPLVIFDCDGVLIDSEAVGARIEVEELQKLGCRITVEEYLHTALGRTEEEAVWKEIADLNHILLPPGFAAAAWKKVADAFTRELRAIPGIEEAIQAIPFEVCVASGSRPERLHRNLEMTGLSRYFGDRVFSAAQVPRGKPHPDLFQYVASILSRTPRECLVVEDSVNGVLAARSAGMTVLGFGGGSHFLPEMETKLLDKGAALVFYDMAELPRLCREHLDSGPA